MASFLAAFTLVASRFPHFEESTILCFKVGFFPVKSFFSGPKTFLESFGPGLSLYFHLGLTVCLALCLRVLFGDSDPLWEFGSPTLAVNLLDLDPLRLLAMPCPFLCGLFLLQVRISILALCPRASFGDPDPLWGSGSPTLAANLVDSHSLRLLATPSPFQFGLSHFQGGSSILVLCPSSLCGDSVLPLGDWVTHSGYQSLGLRCANIVVQLSSFLSGRCPLYIFSVARGSVCPPPGGGSYVSLNP